MPGSVWISSWRSTFDQNGDPTATGRPLRSGTAMRNISLVRNTFVQNRSAVTLPAVAVDSIAQLNVSNNAVRYTGDPEAETSPLTIAITSSTAVTTEDNTCSWEGRADANCNVSSTPPVPTVDNARPRVDGNGARLDSHDAGPFRALAAVALQRPVPVEPAAALADGSRGERGRDQLPRLLLPLQRLRVRRKSREGRGRRSRREPGSRRLSTRRGGARRPVRIGSRKRSRSRCEMHHFDRI